MSLPTCPDCGSPLTATASTCAQCGRSTATRPATATTDAPALNRYEPAASAAPPFFEVGVAKFIVLSIVTWGLYDAFWAYQQWTRIKARRGERLSPFWRTVFAGFWNFSLFRRIQVDSSRAHVPASWSPDFLGVAYFVIAAAWRLPDPWWLVCVLTFVPILPVVRSIAALHDQVVGERDRNARFSVANIVGVCVGSVFFLLVIAGMVGA